MISLKSMIREQNLPKGWTYSRLYGFKVYHLVDEDTIKMVGEKYESESVNTVAQWHTENSTGLDIGANIGLFSLGILQGRDIPGSRIFAFEPNIHTAARLQCTVVENNLQDLMSVMPFAVSDRPGLASYAVHRERSNSGDGFLDTGRAGASRTTAVATTTIDDFVKTQKLKSLAWIKLDIEGAEHLALLGAKNTLHALRPKLILEVHPKNLVPYSVAPADIIGLLDEHNYDMCMLDYQKLTQYQLESLLASGRGANFIAVPRLN